LSFVRHTQLFPKKCLKCHQILLFRVCFSLLFFIVLILLRKRDDLTIWVFLKDIPAILLFVLLLVHNYLLFFILASQLVHQKCEQRLKTCSLKVILQDFFIY